MKLHGEDERLDTAEATEIAGILERIANELREGIDQRVFVACADPGSPGDDYRVVALGYDWGLHGVVQAYSSALADGMLKLPDEECGP